MAIVCKWEEEYDGPWHTECGESFDLNEGTPKDNGMKYCCYCGKKLMSTEQEHTKETNGDSL